MQYCLGYLIDGIDAVHGGGNDAAGIACSFATGVEVAKLGVLEALITGDADGRGGTALSSGSSRPSLRQLR